MPRQKIKIILPDGKEKEGTSFETSALDIAKSISNSLAEKLVVAKVKFLNRVGTLDTGLITGGIVDESDDKGAAADTWELYDCFRPLEGDCEIKLLTFDDPEGKMVFWHSSAHILGESMEREYGVHLCHGPPTDSGFFYDAYCGPKNMFNQDNYKPIEEAAKKVISEKQTFQRIILSKEEALRLFAYNPFKVQLIQTKIPDGGKVTAYRNGDLIDLCTGPHVPVTSRIKAFKVMKNSSAYWLGKATNDSLQRIYGVTFPTKKEMDEYVTLIEEAAKRDHRIIGKQQGLFNHHQLSPGCGFWYPHGSKIYNKLVELIRDEYRVRGYQEVITPNMFNLKLWKTSGHYKNYKDNIYLFKIESQGFGMKPMNCPGHCLMFDNTIRSYRELPLRFGDFGVLHRNEITGALSGLTRVRRFQQDDAHIFCMPTQIMTEVLGVLDFLDHIYGIFGFKFELELSTRPADKLGDDSMWDQAEAALAEALNKFGKPWKENPGDGAFYGPKIDIKVFDALKRPHQCGTVQLDFQLPIRFDLKYKTDAHHEGGAASETGSSHVSESPATVHEEESKKPSLRSEVYPKDELDEEEFVWQEHPLKHGFARPVIIHRAILGSVERFVAILIEHLGGKWPFFLSPRQAIVVPISEKHMDYCESVMLYLHKAGYEVELDRSNAQLNKKIRNAQLDQWNYILVAGEEEAKEGCVDVRSRDG